MTTIAVQLCFGTESFIPITPSSLLSSKTNGEILSSSSSSTSALQIGNLFGGIFSDENSPFPTRTTAKNDDDDASGVKTVLDIPANTIKIGPLKFYLQIFLVGEQNKPVKGSWILNQNDDRGTLDMYYAVDSTGMFSIDLKEYGITVRRYGERPSLQYLLQESVMLHSILDELTQIAFEVDDTIDPSKRLLQFSDDQVLVKVREVLPARRAE
jgi:hypothetical protein